MAGISPSSSPVGNGFDSSVKLRQIKSSQLTAVQAVQGKDYLFSSSVLKEQRRTSLAAVFNEDTKITPFNPLDTTSTSTIISAAKRPKSNQLQEALTHAHTILHSPNTTENEEDNGIDDVTEAFTVLERILGFAKNMNKMEKEQLSPKEKSVYAHAALELSNLLLSQDTLDWHKEAIDYLLVAEELGDPNGHASYLLGKFLLASIKPLPTGSTYKELSNHEQKMVECRNKVKTYLDKSISASKAQGQEDGHAGSNMLLQYMHCTGPDGAPAHDIWGLLSTYIDNNYKGKYAYQAKLHYYLGKLGYQDHLGVKNKEKGINLLTQNTEKLQEGSRMQAKSFFYRGENSFKNKEFADSITYLYAAVVGGCGYIKLLWKYLYDIHCKYTSDKTNDYKLNVCNKFHIVPNDLKNIISKNNMYSRSDLANVDVREQRNCSYIF